MTRTYPKQLGLTATEILLWLDGEPMTRRQLDMRLSTFTSGMHLPRLCERGLVMVTVIGPHRRYVYSLTERGAEMALELGA